MSRAPKQNIIYQEKLNIPEEFLRFATPREVALYRAERLKCNVLLEIGAGIGGQTIAFSKLCNRVIAIELNKTKCKILSNNLKKLKISNVEVINGDALNKSVINKILKEKIDILFVDTERPEKAERTLENISPPITRLLEEYQKITSKIAIEIPPYTNNLDLLNRSFEFEQEFISLDNQLNRLTLYFNELKKSHKKIVALPIREVIEQENKLFDAKKVGFFKEFKFLYSPDPTLIVAGLLDQFAFKNNLTLIQLNKPFLLSNTRFKSPFLVGYKILQGSCFNRERVKEELINLGAKKVIIRYNIDPDDYWKERKFYEKDLKGRKEINLFGSKDINEMVLCEKLEN